MSGPQCTMGCPCRDPLGCPPIPTQHGIGEQSANPLAAAADCTELEAELMCYLQSKKGTITKKKRRKESGLAFRVSSKKTKPSTELSKSIAESDGLVRCRNQNDGRRWRSDKRPHSPAPLFARWSLVKNMEIKMKNSKI